MESNSKNLYEFSWFVAITTFISGWVLFGIWIIAKYFFAFDIQIFEQMGFYWLIIGFNFGVIAFVTNLIVIFRNRKTLKLKLFLPILFLFLNNPSILFFEFCRSNLQNFTFVWLTNNTSQDDLVMQFISTNTNKNFKKLDVDDSVVFHYRPLIDYDDSRKYQQQEKIKLILTHDNVVDTVIFPELSYGRCFQVDVNNDYYIDSKERIFRFK